MKKDYFEQIRNNSKISLREQINTIIMLSIPAIFSQITTVIMEYVDQSMVGRLGADPSAAIGLISSTTWLIGGICNAVSTGFTVQIAHSIGAGNDLFARSIMKHGLIAVLLFSSTLSHLPGYQLRPPLLAWRIFIHSPRCRYIFSHICPRTSYDPPVRSHLGHAPMQRQYQDSQHT